MAGPGPGGQVTPTGAPGVVGVPTSSPAQALYCGSHSPAVGVPQPQTSGDTLGKALASVSCLHISNLLSETAAELVTVLLVAQQAMSVDM